MSNKVKFEKFVENIDWNKRDRLYWKGLYSQVDYNSRNYNMEYSFYQYKKEHSKKDQWPFVVDNYYDEEKTKVVRSCLNSFVTLLKRIRYQKRTGYNPKLILSKENASYCNIDKYTSTGSVVYKIAKEDKQIA